MLVVFDLDLTLIDTSALQIYRDTRRWRDIKNHLRETKLYPNIKEMMQVFQDHNIRMAVVTNSPGMYANDLLRHYSLHVDKVVAYHDTKRHKPDPEPFLLAMSLLGSDQKHTVAIGDSVNDIIAAKRAGIVSCAALWDCGDQEAVRKAAPDRVFETPHSFLNYILEVCNE